MTEYIFTNGRIITMEPAMPTAEAIGIRAGRIAALGGLADLRRLLPRAQTIDLRGCALLPGFIDGHSHFPSGGMNRLFAADCGVAAMPELLERLRARAAGECLGQWVVGYGFDNCRMGGEPRREDLDAAVPHRPVFMRHVSGHRGYANSAALELAGIGRDTPNPAGGIIQRNPDGSPNGILDGIPAQTLVRRLIPPLTEQQMAEALIAESRVYAKAGITTAQGGPAYSPMDAEIGARVVDLFVNMAQKGELPLRVVLFMRGTRPDIYQNLGLSQAGSDLSGNGMVTLGAVKFFADGDPRCGTGFFSSPYPGNERNYGESLYTARELADLILPLHRAGWQIAVHANGDAGVENVLLAYECCQRAWPRPHCRHLAIHAEYATTAQLARMKMLGVHPAFFLAPLYWWDDIHAREVGEDRVEDFCRIGDASRMGLRFNLHTDSPILPVDPLVEVCMAATRMSCHGRVWGRRQAIGVWEALRAVTIDAAYLNFEEHVKGSLAPGKYADFTILDKSPLDAPPDEIKNIKVLSTLVGGREVYAGQETFLHKENFQ